MPKVENFCSGVRVSFQRGFDVVTGKKIVPSNVVSSVGSLSVVQLSERQRKILELIKENPFVSGEQMSVVLSVVKRTIERDLAAMQKKGVLVHEGNTSAGHWVVIDNK